MHGRPCERRLKRFWPAALVVTCGCLSALHGCKGDDDDEGGGTADDVAASGAAGEAGEAAGGQPAAGTSRPGDARGGAAAAGAEGDQAGAAGAVVAAGAAGAPSVGEDGIPVALSLGGVFTAVLLSNGGVEQIGGNTNNQVCNPVSSTNSKPVIVAGEQDRKTPLRGARGIGAGSGNLCIIQADATVQCCGDNTYSQKSNNRAGGGSEGAAVATSDGRVVTDVTEVSVGYGHICALREGGAISCWGAGAEGQLGGGSLFYSHAPVDVLDPDGVTPLTGARSVAAGIFHTCALLSEGNVACWGSNTSSELGNGTSSYRSAVPVIVQTEDGSPLTGVVAISAGFAYACALIDDGTVMCWGSNNHGQLGDAAEDEQAFAAPVLDADGEELSKITALSAGTYHACALQQKGTVWCWGSNSYGQLGIGTDVQSAFAVQVPGLIGAKTVAAGGSSNRGEHTCALWDDGTVQCWGANNYDQLNDPDITGVNSSTPVVIDGL